MRRKLTGLTITLFFVSALLFALAACTTVVTDFSAIVSKTVYEVDEAFDFSTAKLKIFYGDGTSGYLNMNAKMLSGFDTATSGDKTMQVAYGGKTKQVAYSVTGSIETKTRLAVDRGAGAECVVRLKNTEFSIYAVTFTVEGEALPDTVKALPTGWTAVTKLRENAISVLLYPTNGLPLTDNVVLINFLCPSDAAFVFKGITVATDAREYALPDAEL